MELDLREGSLLDPAVTGPGDVMDKASAQRGLWKLMLKLPAMRGKLQIFSAQNQDILGLCEAFEQAYGMLDGLRKAPAPDLKLMLEYENLCSDIENEVVELCILLDRKK
jgi:hypothetical protein